MKLYKKLDATQNALKVWNKKVFGHCQTRIDELIQKEDGTKENYRRETNLQNDLNEWLFRSEVLWKQKSREILLKGDKNSKIFHFSTIIHRRRNAIDAVKSKSRRWITDSKEIREFFLESFKNHFTQETVDFSPELEDLITPCISVEENEEISKIPPPLNIRDTLFQMQDLKAPGLDGFPAIFYKEYWSIIGEVVTRAVIFFYFIFYFYFFYNSSRMPCEVNSSLIVLIPKTQNPSSFNNFRPISLCNIVYKIIPKISV